MICFIRLPAFNELLDDCCLARRRVAAKTILIRVIIGLCVLEEAIRNRRSLMVALCVYSRIIKLASTVVVTHLDPTSQFKT